MFDQDWEQAQATVVAARDLTNWSGDPSSTVTQSRPHEYVVDVRPAGQPAFRATFRDPYIRGHRDYPQEGQVVNVLCKVKSQKVKLIAAEWKLQVGDGDEKQAQDERFQAARDGQVGESTPPGPTDA